MYRTIIALLLWAVAGSAWAQHDGYKLFAETRSFRFYAPPDPPKLFFSLAAEAEEMFAPIAAVSGYTAKEPTDVYLTLDHPSFVALGNPEYAIGIARPAKNEVGLALRDRYGKTNDLFAVFRHEASHIALLRAAQENADSLPRWFVEGFAEWQAKEHSILQDNELLTAARTNQLLPLYQLNNGFPQDDTQIGVAYAQSAAFVRHMALLHGENAINNIVALVAKGEPFGVAVRLALGSNLSQMEASFFDELRKSTSWFPFLADMNWMWGLAAILFVFAYLKKRKEIKLAIQNMRDEDPFFVPAELTFASVAPMMFASLSAQAAMNDDVPQAQCICKEDATLDRCPEQTSSDSQDEAWTQKPGFSALD
jgi:hypothetical protein